MAEQDQNRNLPATPFKLKEAKKRGQVAKSQEVTSFIALFSLLIAIYAFGMGAVKKQASLSHFIFDSAHRIRFEIDPLIAWFAQIAEQLFMIILPFVLLAMLLGVLANLIQTGPIFSVFPIKPDPKRLNPIEGFKKIFSIRIVIELIKSVLKIGAFMLVGYAVIIGLIPVLFQLMGRDPVSYPSFLIGEITALLFKLIIIVLIAAIIDLIYVRRDFAKKMMMSYRDMKDEVKRREGDPDIRSKRKSIQRELLKKTQAVGRVPEADVIVTNPTHLAVALKYTRGEMDAPEIIAKGAGELALNMRKVARKNNVPIVENKPLARKLYLLGSIDQAIPDICFPAVANILAWVYGLRSDLREGVACR